MASPRAPHRFDLKLLGGAAVQFDDGRPVGGAVGQRHRLALLALLAMSQPGGVRRDKLIGFVWPERDEKSARHLLRVAIHDMRRMLGTSSITAVGEELQLNPAFVRSDVAAFERALDVGDRETAVAAYGGPFLDGFFLQDANAFDEWMEHERRRLGQRYEEALAALAQTATERGDTTRAAAWLRALANRRPADSQVARRLIDALAAADDLSGALAHAATHADHLRAEHGIGPDAAFVARVNTLRRTAPAPVVVPPPAADVAPAPVATPIRAEEPVVVAPTIAVTPIGSPAPATIAFARRRVWQIAAVIAAIVAVMIGGQRIAMGRSEVPSAALAIAPFTVAGTAAQELGEGIPALLAANLDQVAEVRVVPSRVSLARAAELARSGDASPERLARATRAGTVVTGVITARGGGLEVRATLLSAAGVQLAQATASGSADDLPGLVDRLSLGVLREIWGQRWGVPSPRLAAISTTSSEAMRAYVRGEAFLRGAQWDSAAARFAQAVDLDSTFALAHLRLSEAYGWRKAMSGPAAQHELAAATRFAYRLPPRDRALVVIRRLHVVGDLAALDSAETLSARYPSDPEVQYVRADVRFHVEMSPRIQGSNFVFAAFDTAAALDSLSTRVFSHVVELAVERGDSGRYDRAVARLTALAAAAGEPTDAAMYALLRTVRWSPSPAAAYDALVHGLRALPPSAGRNENLLRAFERAILFAPHPEPGRMVDGIAALQAAYGDSVSLVTNVESRRAIFLSGTGQMAAARPYINHMWEGNPTGAIGMLITPVVFGYAAPSTIADAAARIDHTPYWSESYVRRREAAYWHGVLSLLAGDTTAARSAFRVAGTSAQRAPDDTVSREIAGALRGAEGWMRLVAGDSAGALRLMESAERLVGYDSRGILLNRPAHVLQLQLLARRPERRAEAIQRLSATVQRMYTWVWWRHELADVLALDGDSAAAAAERAQFDAIWAGPRSLASATPPAGTTVR